MTVGWSEFETNMGRAFRELRNDFLDVTLGCEDVHIQAHKVILSASSTFFRSVFRNNPHSHPLLYLLGINKTSLRYVVDFMYHGEVSIAKDDLGTFLDVAQQLGVKGLSGIHHKEENFPEIHEPRNKIQPTRVKMEPSEDIQTPSSPEVSINVNETIMMVNTELVTENKVSEERWKNKTGNVCQEDSVVIGDDMNDVGCESGHLMIKEELPDVTEDWEEIAANPSCLVIDRSFSVKKDHFTEHLKRTYKSLDIKKKAEPESNSESERPRLKQRTYNAHIKAESALYSDSNSESCSDSELPGVGYRRIQIQNKIICRICRKRIPKGSLKQHLVRTHYKAELTEIYHHVVKDKQCCFCERCFLGYGPSAIIEHIGAFHNKVFDFYKT